MKSFNTYKVEPEHQGLTVEHYLKNVLQYSGRKVQKLTRIKGVTLNKKTVFLQKKLKPGDVLGVRILEDQSYGVIPEEGSLEVLFEDSHLIVLNKQPGVLVHPTGQTTQGTLANFLAFYFQEQGALLTIRPVHRLDRDTSGCVVFAKDAQTQSILEQQLHDGVFKRTYHAIIEGEIECESGIIDVPIGMHPTMPNRRTVNEKGERAVTHYRTLKNIPATERFPEASLIEMKLETGRTHQIRVHLAHVGHPVIGDRMYGKRSNLILRQALHAVSISFIHPKEEQEITLYAPYPEDFRRLIE